METVTASHFVSRIHGGKTSMDSKITLAHIGMTNLSLAHNGWRTVNRVDLLQMKNKVKVTRKQWSASNKTESDKALGKIICGTGMNVCFVSAECGPWSKTGGLGDVLGGLPPALAANGHRVMTVSPRHDQYRDAWDTSVLVEVKIGDKIETVRFFHCYKRGIDRVFVDHPMFLEKVWGKTESKVYGPNSGTDYEDNQLRFSLLCQAALEAPRVLNLNCSKYFSGPYGEDVIFVANDWHTALLPCYLKSMYQSRGIYMNAKVMDAKPLQKEALQAAVGLHVDRNIPVIGFIGRLEEQKGSDILVAAIPKLAQMNVQIIILGTGKKRFEQQIQQLEVMYPNKARGLTKFNVPLAHMITAGADFMLIPSRFEPCGLIQLHAMRYGTIPICASTGGLVDTVKEGYTGFQMGDFNVECQKVDPADVVKIVAGVSRALAVFGTMTLTQMIRNCMSQELSWKGPAKKWELMLLSLAVAGIEVCVDEGEEIAPLAMENVATP